VLPGATRDSIVATGFLVAGPYDEAGTSSVSVLLRAKVREEELEDMLAAVGQTFLGMTVIALAATITSSTRFRSAITTGSNPIRSVRHGDRPILTADEQRARGAIVNPDRPRDFNSRI